MKATEISGKKWFTGGSMRRMKVLLAIILSGGLALAVGLPVSAAVTTGKSKHKTVIDVWLADYPLPGYLDERKRLADEFNRLHPRYQINIEAHDYTALPQDVDRAARAGNPPEVANYYYNATQIARDARDRTGRPLFTSVERAIGGRSHILGHRVVTGDLHSQVRAYYTQRGELTSFPITSMTSLIYGNTTIMTAAGVTRMPRTWPEIQAACAAVMKLPTAPERCITWPNHNWFIQQALAHQDAAVTNRDNGHSGRATRVYLDSPQMIRYARWWQQMHRSGQYLYTGTTEDWGGNFEAFTSQRVAFVLDAANQGDTFAQMGQAAGFGVQAGRLPHDGGPGPVGNVSSGDSLWLRAGLDRATQDGALAFMQFLNNPANSVTWHKSTSYLPLTGDAVRALETEGWFAEHPAAKVALDQIRSARRSPAALGPVVGAFDGIQNELVLAMEDVLLRNADPATRLHEADRRAQRLLDAYGANCTNAGPRGVDCFRVGVWG
jgi:sn-glycerol 3-phosphate transport system substrate-binding protein